MELEISNHFLLRFYSEENETPLTLFFFFPIGGFFFFLSFFFDLEWFLFNLVFFPFFFFFFFSQISDCFVIEGFFLGRDLGVHTVPWVWIVYVQYVGTYVYICRYLRR